MKLHLLLTLAFVAVRMSSAQYRKADPNSDRTTPEPEPFYCADCTPWETNPGHPGGLRWLCMHTNPPMECPLSNYEFCKKYCEGAAKATPYVGDVDTI